MSYPANDITAELQAAAAKNGSGYVSLAAGVSLFHQVVAVQREVEIEGQGIGTSILRMYGLPTSVVVYGTTCTGPAGWFLDASGYPLGPPIRKKLPKHPHGVQFAPFANDGNITGPYFHDWSFDSNIHVPTDTWAGTPWFPREGTGIATGTRLINFEVMNNYGGKGWCPDAVHIGATDTYVENYYMTRFAISPDLVVHNDQPGGLVGGGGQGDLSTTTNVTVKNAVMPYAFLEIDGTMPGLQIDGMACAKCLMGTRIGSASWQGAFWNDVVMHLDSPAAGPVLNFSKGTGPYTDFTIENSSFTGGTGIHNPQLFQGVWGPNNDPPTLPEALPPPNPALILGATAGLAAGTYLAYRALQSRAPYRAPAPRRVVA